MMIYVPKGIVVHASESLVPHNLLLWRPNGLKGTAPRALCKAALSAMSSMTKAKTSECDLNLSDLASRTYRFKPELEESTSRSCSYPSYRRHGLHDAQSASERVPSTCHPLLSRHSLVLSLVYHINLADKNRTAHRHRDACDR